jgi:hypothetical protein
MHRASILMLLSFLSLAALACAGSTPAPDGPKPAPQAQEGEVCPADGTDADGKPKCPKGCVFNGTECRKDLGIIVHESPAP